MTNGRHKYATSTTLLVRSSFLNLDCPIESINFSLLFVYSFFKKGADVSPLSDS